MIVTVTGSTHITQMLTFVGMSQKPLFVGRTTTITIATIGTITIGMV